MEKLKNKLVQEDIELAKRVHYGFLPDGYEDEMLDVSVKMIAHDQLGGDYCGVFPVGDDLVIASMCDASGHGIASALYAARINTFVLSHGQQIQNPCGLITKMNAFFCQHMPITNMQCSFFILIFDKKNYTVSYSGAGHPAVTRFNSRTGDIELLESSTTLIGIQDPLLVACQSRKLQLYPGDRLLMYTDGLTEGRDENGNYFGTSDIARILSSNSEQPANSKCINEQLLQNLKHFTGDNLQDDVLSMVFTIAEQDS